MSTRIVERALPVTLREVTRHNIQALMVLDAGDGGRQGAPSAKSMAQAASRAYLGAILGRPRRKAAAADVAEAVGAAAV